MTVGPRSQCDACRHFRPPSMADFMAIAAPTCDAFPDGIPQRVLGNGLDHREPVDGDHGIRFEAKAGDTYPEYALA